MATKKKVTKVTKKVTKKVIKKPVKVKKEPKYEVKVTIPGSCVRSPGIPKGNWEFWL
jgi:hypothetical protein